MSRALLVCACLLAAAGMAQSISSTSTSVAGPIQVSAPDGGLRVTLGTEEVGVNLLTAPRLEAAVSMEPGTFLAVAGDTTGSILRAEVTGSVGGPVVTLVSGTPTVQLSTSALALLAGQRNCSYLPLGNPTISGAPTPLPRTSSQTGITVQAHDFGVLVDWVSCWPETLDAGPLPNCYADGGVGYALHAGGAIDLDITSAHRVHCLTCVHGANPAAQTAQIAGGVTSCIP